MSLIQETRAPLGVSHSLGTSDFHSDRLLPSASKMTEAWALRLMLALLYLSVRSKRLANKDGDNSPE
jgi:hypothetical protein